MKNSLERKIILFAFIILFLTTLANSGMDIASFRRDYIQALILRTQSIGMSLKSSVEKILVLGIDLRDISGLNEKCREVVSSNPEIAYAIISGPDGSVLHSNDPAFDRLQIKPDEASGSPHHTQIVTGNNRSYYSTSTAIVSYDGRVSGYIHVGFPQDTVDSKIYGMALKSGAIFIVFFLVSFALVIFFIKRGITGPIETLLGSVKKIAEGDFQASVPKLSSNEFTELGEKINSMAQAIASRDAELRANYEELANTHTKLQESFEKLESLSLELEKSEELYKSLLEDAGDAIIVLDQNESVSIVNKKAEEFLGYNAEELMGRHISSVLLMLNVENINHLLQVIKRGFNDIESTEEINILPRIQEKVIGRIQTSCIKTGGKALLQIIIRDVTKERETLTNLEKSAAELARLNTMKDSFLGLASHELKTPLTVIMGYTELLLNDMTDELTPTSLEMLQNISNASIRLNGIIKDMIDVSMIDRKQLSLKLEPIDINQLVESAVQEHRIFFAMRKQNLHLELTHDIPTISGDRVRLMQLLANLISNAIKFTPDSGSITITTTVQNLMRNKQPAVLENHPTVMSIGKEPHRFVQIAIKDTGIGIDKEDQLRILDKFYEAGNIEEHSTGKVAFKSRGTGLGLSIAKGVAEMHGGEIWVESPGHDPEKFPGSTFLILLPLDPVKGDGTIDYMNL